MKKNDRHFYIINLFSLGFYFLVLWNLNIGISEVMFFTEDARSYYDVSLWLMGGEENIHIVRRPILYPIILLVFKGIGGDTGIWFIHLIFWLFTINLIFRSVYILTKNYIFSYAGVLIILMNISLIAFTFHALAETSCVFMVSLLVYYFVKNINRRRELRFIHSCILLLGLLTILKPVFFVPTLLVLFVITPLFYRKEYMLNPNKLGTLLLVLLPLIIQISVVKYNSGNFAISEIGSQTFTNYLFAQGIQKHDELERMEAIERAQNLTSSEKRKYLNEHRYSYFNLYKNNLEKNLLGYPSFLTFPEILKQNPFKDYMIKLNEILYKIHLFFILFIVVFIAKALINKNYENLILIAAMSALCAYLLLVSGISYWQGDRLLLTAIPLWICIYIKIISEYLTYLKYRRELK